MYEPVNFADPKWLIVSPSARTLIKNLLRKHPENRISLELVLNSEWITSGLGNNASLKRQRRSSVSSPSAKFEAYTKTSFE